MHYPLAYLVTAPRFLGYLFNPVSFWYLYENDLSLKAMILEVNNTFDERRMYFLDQKSRIAVKVPSGSGEEPPARFADTWSKDFHVSPFNSRKGSYSLNALDPFMPTSTSNPLISNVITLTSSKGHPKLVAIIKSTTSSTDPSTFSSYDILRFIASWWWVGLVTFPRIVKEAAKLFFRRKLHVWYRPEVLENSICRTATNYERYGSTLLYPSGCN